ncbi:hypothetical protein GUJ93_ZPchr0001g32314 [Zizania palustris]|uniref:Uncharacterized protein n=1 Tax=Zizania palustris TaxID=103762 RepID=A0A8J5RPS4_ZIZPA|nr:hypothetical protein GUJ93_ZPchr0001g32314 [Zizania palustris]
MVRMVVSVADVADPPPAGVCPTVILEGVSRELVRLIELHGVAGHVFAVYGAHFGIQDDPRRQSCQLPLHRGAAEGVLCPVAYLREHGRRPRGPGLAAPTVPPRNSWMSADEDITCRAVHEAAMTLQEVHRMRHAVVLEFFDAWMVLNR